MKNNPTDLDTTKKLTLVYVLGAGRSGSTLLDAVLGMNKNIFSLGEFINVARAYQRNTFCSCGSRLQQCDFWEGIFLASQLHINDMIADQESDPLFMRGHKIREICGIFTRLFFKRKQKINKQFARRQEILFKTIAEKSQSQFLVDSSKKPLRILSIMDGCDLDIQVVYIVRDARGYMLSRRSGKGSRQLSTAPALLSWVMQNILALLTYIQAPKSNRRMLSYEQFARDPNTEIGQLLNHIGIINRSSDFSYCDPSVSHMVAGNMMKKDGRTKIREKINWGKDIRYLDHILYYFIAAWLQQLIKCICRTNSQQ
jgi:hypothetical protein